MEKVTFVNITVCETCTFRCKMCFFWKNRGPAFPPSNIYDSLPESLSEILHEKGEVFITGGEPLLWNGVYGLITKLRKKRLKVKLNTNAFLLNETSIKSLKESGLDTYTISLDGFKEETHDMIRGVKGSYKKIMNAITLLKRTYGKSSLHIYITTTISALNYSEIPKLIQLVDKMEAVESVWLQTISKPFYSQKKDISSFNWYRDDEFNELWPKEDMTNFFSEIINMKKSGSKIGNTFEHLNNQHLYFKYPQKTAKYCNVLTKIDIDIHGNVRMCNYQYGLPIGNLQKESLKDIWNSKERKNKQAIMLKCSSPCHETRNCKNTGIN